MRAQSTLELINGFGVGVGVGVVGGAVGVAVAVGLGVAVAIGVGVAVGAGEVAAAVSLNVEKVAKIDPSSTNLIRMFVSLFCCFCRPEYCRHLEGESASKLLRKSAR